MKNSCTCAVNGLWGMLRSGLWLMGLAHLLFTLPLSAQTGNPPSDAQLEQDVQLLLANDDNVAELKRQVTAKEITNVEYTKQLPALTAARTAIVKQYDRAGYQKLIALYNAAKKDKLQAVAQAKAAAAAEAKAKAAAEKEAARLAAAKAAEEKAAAAKAAAEAQAREVADDAQTFVKVQLREVELSFKNYVGTISDAEKQEQPGLTTAAAEIRKKYATGGEAQARARDFQQQTNQLYQSQFPVARVQWLVDAFPGAERVTADYSDESKRAAAFILLTDLLGKKAGVPTPAVAEQKIRTYQQAVDAVNTPHKNKDGSTPKEYWDYVKQNTDLAAKPEFQVEVLKKYLPPLAGEVEAQMAADKQRAAIEKEVARQVARGKLLGGVLSLLFVALMAVPLLMAWRVKPAKPVPASSSGPLQLPNSLAVVKVFRREYPVEFEGGLVYEKEVWTETNVSTTTSGGGSYVAGGVVHSSPVQTTTHVSTTVYHRYWIRTPEGRETWRRFSDNVFPASKGHIISTISRDKDVLLAYNHSTGQFATLDPGIKASHYLKGRWIILITMALWVVGSLVITTVLGGEGVGRRNSDFVTGGALGIGVFTCFYVLILKIVFVILRTRQFKSKYVPQFRQFMEQATPELEKRLAGAVTQADS